MKAEIFSVFTLLEELQESSGKKNFYITGQLGESDFLNENGRVYPHALMERQVSRLKTRLEKRNTLMAGNHPINEKDASKPPRIRLEDQAARLVDVWMEGKKIMGKAIIAETDAGRNVKALVDIGTAVGISSRGAGSTKQEKWNGTEAAVVQDNYILETFDFVVDPSVPHAGVQDSFVESKETDMADNEMTIEELKEKNPKLYATLNEHFEKRLIERVKSEKTALENVVEARVTEEVDKVVKKLKEDMGAAEVPATAIHYFAAINQFLTNLKALGFPAGDLTTEGDPSADSITKRQNGGRVGGMNTDTSWGNKTGSGDSTVMSGKESRESELKAGQDKLFEEVGDLRAELQKAKVDKYILEKTTGIEYGDVIKGRLGECLTIEDVDAKILSESAYIKALTERAKKNAETPAGKGQTFTSNPNSPMNESKDSTEKTAKNPLLSMIGRRTVAAK